MCINPQSLHNSNSLQHSFPKICLSFPSPQNVKYKLLLDITLIPKFKMVLLVISSPEEMVEPLPYLI